MHIVEGKAGLAALAERLGLHWQLAGNLRQLCGWDIVGKDRAVRRVAGGWTLVDYVKWMQRADSATLLPVFGSAPDIHQKHRCFQEDGVNELALKRLLNGSKQETNGWMCLNPGKSPPTSFVQNIRDGESLCGRIRSGVLPVVAPQQVLQLCVRVAAPRAPSCCPAREQP